jgi:protein-S-isoprenylcysteine O-methyltransferase Ste14
VAVLAASISTSRRAESLGDATGPYRFIRHPGYLAMLVTMPATAATLGSPAVLLPAVGYELLILNRMVREDGFLRNTLGGYAQ